MRSVGKVILKVLLAVSVAAVFVIVNILSISKGSADGIADTIPLQSTAYSHSGIPIIMYHSVSDTPPAGVQEFTISPDNFSDQMKYLADNGYTPIYLNELKSCSQLKKPIVITFDDGYVDNYINAYPILKRFNFKSTIFVITKSIGTAGHLTKDQISVMEDLVSFQSHTVDHLKLDELTSNQIEYECLQSKTDLSAITNKPVYALAYPNGNFNPVTISIASKYYTYGVTTMDGLEQKDDGNYLMRRLTIFNSDTLDSFSRKINPA